MLILNPKELELAHKYYSPSETQITWAKEIISLSEEAYSLGTGVSIKNGKFVGPPMVKMAKQILDRHYNVQ